MTLVTSVDGGLVLAVVPVDPELDLKALAGAVGRRRAEMADAAASAARRSSRLPVAAACSSSSRSRT